MKICLITNPDDVSRRRVVRRLGDSILEKQHQIVLSKPLATLLANDDDNEGTGQRLAEANEQQLSIAATEQEAASRCDVMIAVGGDGTMLHAARLAGRSETPILGINSGRLGFLADTPMHRAEEALHHLVAGNWRSEKRFVLQASSQGSETAHYALNEFLFSKHSGVSMITLEVYCDGRKINTYWADGLIIATPTGSTAYNLSAGGPIILPETEVMVITPVCPHALTTRPLVLPANRCIEVRPVPAEQELLFSNDGRICGTEAHQLRGIEITRSDFMIHLIKLPGQNYFQTLRSKLMWGMDLRN
ncbi:MAG: NAD(+)/NADH kinase [Cyclonatronaceae bacterium]